MITVYESKDSCCGCGACSNACPKECIIMKADTEGFLYPQNRQVQMCQLWKM